MSLLSPAGIAESSCPGQYATPPGFSLYFISNHFSNGSFITVITSSRVSGYGAGGGATGGATGGVCEGILKIGIYPSGRVEK